MNSDNRLSKHRHDHSVGGIGAWEFHVVGELVGWNALQNQLTSISVFAFVALKWNSKESNSDGNNEAKNDYGQNPPPSAKGLAAIINLMSHKSCYFDEKPDVATRAFEIRPLLTSVGVFRLHKTSTREEPIFRRFA